MPIENIARLLVRRSPNYEINDMQIAISLKLGG
jgi:hypothetical protein